MHAAYGTAAATEPTPAFGAVTESGLDEASLAFAPRLRHGLLGLAIGIAALLLAAALGIWTVAAVFHTAPAALT